MNKRTKKTVSLNEALARARKYCALNERTIRDVSRKFEEYGVMKGDLPDLLEALIHEGFLNERRFATAFAGGKFRMKKWGRNRIKAEMKKKGLPEELITVGLAEIHVQGYLETLDAILIRKLNILKRKKKERQQIIASLMRYALQKGYEHSLVSERIKNLGFDEEI